MTMDSCTCTPPYAQRACARTNPYTNGAQLKPRLQCFVFILEFNARLHDLSENVEVFSYAVHDIKRCTKIIKVVELVLAIGESCVVIVCACVSVLIISFYFDCSG